MHLHDLGEWLGQEPMLRRPHAILGHAPSRMPQTRRHSAITLAHPQQAQQFHDIHRRDPPRTHQQLSPFYGGECRISSEPRRPSLPTRQYAHHWRPLAVNSWRPLAVKTWHPLAVNDVSTIARKMTPPKWCIYELW